MNERHGPTPPNELRSGHQMTDSGAAVNCDLVSTFPLLAMGETKCEGDPMIASQRTSDVASVLPARHSKFEVDSANVFKLLRPWRHFPLYGSLISSHVASDVSAY